MTDKVVIITGGSRGIGRAAALKAAAAGFRVVIGYASNEAAANEVASTIAATNGNWSSPWTMCWNAPPILGAGSSPVRALFTNASPATAKAPRR